MRPLSFLLLTLFFFFNIPFSSSSSDSSTVTQLFDNWCEEYGKKFSSENERQYRLKVFEDNSVFVAQHNTMANSTYTLHLNGFADLTHTEFKASRLGLSPGTIRLSNESLNLHEPVFVGDNIPASVDWRDEGAVTNVKDQSTCGACWSFSATGAIEGINKIVTGSLVSLSEQELVDCDKTYNSGCGGGLMDYAFEFVKENHGIDIEDDYPYQAKEKSCNKEKLKRHVVTIDGYSDVPPNNEKSLLKAVATQPVSVGICGSERAFQLYSKGIFTGPCSTDLDHAVLIVGYGSANGIDYWIVKNSWGRHWGVDGYIYIARNYGDSRSGICGINLLASYPTKTNPNPPPPPSPGPTKCNLFTHCSQGETCCCTYSILGICFSWKCCELDSAVCCKDGYHCCPHDFPICDTQNNQCVKRTGNVTKLLGFDKKGSSGKIESWRSIMEGWIF